MAHRIVNLGVNAQIGRRNLASPVAPGERRPRLTDKKHLAFIRMLPCLVTGRSGAGIEAAHLRQESLALWEKRHTGMQIKPDDNWVNPLSHDLHALQGDLNEYRFWKTAGTDPFQSARLLYSLSDNLKEGTEAALEIFHRHICHWNTDTEKAFGR